MKPKTKLHHEVLKLHKKLPKITSKHTKWAYAKIFKFWAYKTKYTTVCFECGHKWNEERGLISTLFCTCPKCHKKLNMAETMSWSKREDDYFQIITTIEGFQVLRIIEISHYCKKGYPAHYYFHEVYQQWISSKGKLVILAVGCNIMGEWRSRHTSWCWHTPMEIRRENDRYFINNLKSYPERKILPIIKRNGYNGNFHNFNKGYFFSLLLSNNRFETLLKTGQYSLLSKISDYYEPAKNLWPQIKICFRHDYIVENASDWFDYLRLLIHFEMDIFNPKFICPENFKISHDELVARKQRIEDRNQAAAERRVIEENLIFKKAKRKLMDLIFTDGIVTIVPLKTVMDFKTEEKILGHCVYSSEYHKKDTSLIMSARKEDERLETIEISLRDFSVRQCRGYKNDNSKYHDRILKLLEINIPNIEIAFRSNGNPKTKCKLVLKPQPVLA